DSMRVLGSTFRSGLVFSKLGGHSGDIVGSDSTPAEEMPAVGGAHARGRPASVPELNPEGESRPARGYFGEPTKPVDEQDDTEIDGPADQGFDPPEESATEEPDDTDRPVSDRLDETGAPTRRNIKND